MIAPVAAARIVVLLLAALLVCPRAGGATLEIALADAPRADVPVPHIETEGEALGRDAGEYGRAFGVPAEEAMRRLRAQQGSVAATDRLQRAYADRLAGIAIEHVPEYRIVVLLTGSDPVPDRIVLAGGMRVPVHFRTGASATREAMIDAIDAGQPAIRSALPMVQGLGVDQRAGQIVALFRAGDFERIGEEALAARIVAIVGVPVQIRSIDRPDADSAIEGGSRVEGANAEDHLRYVCTSGFAVTDGARTGLTTAAHCPYALRYRAPDGSLAPLAYVGAWGAGNQDVQIQAGDEAPSPFVYADARRTIARPITGWRPRHAIRTGDFVCHRGEHTGYGCALVDLVDYAPPANLCAGPCRPVWVAVDGPSCGGGDSGAPVFDGTIALGVVKGASFGRGFGCNFYFYMSVDYLPVGWSVLTTGAGRAGPRS